MISALDRKLIRDVWSMKGQTVAICLVIGCGVATFIMSLTTIFSLETTQQTYYERYRFADVFSHVKRAPRTLEDRIAEIPGVANVQTRIVADVTLHVPDLTEPAVGRLVSIPDRGEPILNHLYLRSGRMPEPGRKGEVVASEAFVEAHKLKLGDRIGANNADRANGAADPAYDDRRDERIYAILNGRKQELIIVGVALSPEYVFQIRPGDMLPDDKRFGVFWMGYTDLAAAFDMQGAFNDIALSLLPGASEPDVLERLNRLTAPYGGDGAYGRADQVSNHYLSDEIKQLKATSMIGPSVFLSVAAFLLNVVLSRLISTQREQIAALKAFGYSHREVGFHYLKMVLLVVVLGSIIGIGLGAWLGKGLTLMYSQLYRFPVFYYEFRVPFVVLALAVAAVAGVLGTLGAVRKAVKLPPAEAMRPEPPANFKPTLVERVGLGRLLSPGARMVLRNLERKPVRAGLSIVGIAMATSILVLSAFGEDAIFYLMDFQFSINQRQNLTVTFIEPSARKAVQELQQIQGVHHVEPFRAVAVRLRAEHRWRRQAITGLPAERHLNLVLDKNEQRARVPPEGLVLSEKLAELLDVKPGDMLTVEVLEGQRTVREVPIVSLVADYAGTNAYMDVGALQRLSGGGETFSGAYMTADTKSLDTLYKKLKETPKVAGVAVQEAAMNSFRDTIAENLMVMRAIQVLMAVVIAAGVVYNTARISLSERSRELASLRVMGFTRGEISSILLGELGVLTLLAIPVGLVMGYGFAVLITVAMQTELFRIPLVIHPSTYAFSATVVLVASVASGLIVRRKLDHLDLVAVLKSRE